MPRFVDLTMPVRDGMPVFPGDPTVIIRPALRIRDGDGANVSALRLGSHSGTHVDAPRHVDDAAPALDAITLDRLVGRPLIADVRRPTDRSPIEAGELHDVLAAGVADRILLLLTRTDEGPHAPSRAERGGGDRRCGPARGRDRRDQRGRARR